MGDSLPKQICTTVFNCHLMQITYSYTAETHSSFSLIFTVSLHYW